MQFSIILSAFAATTVVSAWSVELTEDNGHFINEACDILSTPLETRDIEKRCSYSGFNDCYDRLPSCRDCNEGSGSLGSCLACLGYCEGQCC